MKRSGVVTIIIMVVVIAVIASYFFLRDESSIQKKRNTPAASALLLDDGVQSFTDKNGEALTLNNYIGEVLVVNSWASWCPHCVADFSVLSDVQNEFKDSGVVVLTINRGENRFTAERYLSTITVPDNLQIIIDPADHFFTAAEGYTMPETILYNRDGSIALHQRGNIQVEELKEAITVAVDK